MKDVGGRLGGQQRTSPHSSTLKRGSSCVSKVNLENEPPNSPTVTNIQLLLRRTLSIHPCKQDQLYPVFPISPLLNGLITPPVSTLTSHICHGNWYFLSFV